MRLNVQPAVANWDDARPMNLMFNTRIGAMKGRTAYMRQGSLGMFMLCQALYRHFRNNSHSAQFRLAKDTAMKLIRDKE